MSDEKNEILKIVKFKLGITSSLRDTLLLHLIDNACFFVESKGIKLVLTDGLIFGFVVDFTCFKYKNVDFLGLPRFLDYQLKNLIVRSLSDET